MVKSNKTQHLVSNLESYLVWRKRYEYYPQAPSFSPELNLQTHTTLHV